MQAFDIYFRGESLPDVDPDTVRRQVGTLFKVEGEALDRLFTGKPVRVKKGVDVETASRYRARFREAGALVDIVPSGQTPPSHEAAEAATAMSPVQGGSVGSQGTAPPTGDLAAPGTVLDDTPPPPPADIDTSGLEALPANTGSLEDCKQNKSPYPIPDISHLQLVDD